VGFGAIIRGQENQSWIEYLQLPSGFCCSQVSVWRPLPTGTARIIATITPISTTIIIRTTGTIITSAGLKNAPLLGNK